jgi:centractin
MTGGLEADIFLGSLADEYRGLLNIRYPMEHGIIKDWNDMEKVWQHIYSKSQLNCSSEEVWTLE